MINRYERERRGTYAMPIAMYRKMAFLSPNFLFTHRSVTRPSARPAKKPEEMYPDDDPPPRSLIINVTIQPIVQVRQCPFESSAWPLTSNRHFQPNVDEHKPSEDMDM